MAKYPFRRRVAASILSFALSLSMAVAPLASEVETPDTTIGQEEGTDGEPAEQVQPENEAVSAPVVEQETPAPEVTQPAPVIESVPEVTEKEETPALAEEKSTETLETEPQEESKVSDTQVQESTQDIPEPASQESAEESTEAGNTNPAEKTDAEAADGVKPGEAVADAPLPDEGDAGSETESEEEEAGPEASNQTKKTAFLNEAAPQAASNNAPAEKVEGAEESKESTANRGGMLGSSLVSTAGTITVTAKDDDGNLIEGAVFAITNEDGEEVDRVTTGDDGTAVTKMLPAVTRIQDDAGAVSVREYRYTVSATDEWPMDGYMLREPYAGYMEAVFSENGGSSQNLDCVFTYEYEGWEIVSTADLIIEVKDSKGNPVGGYTFFVEEVNEEAPIAYSVEVGEDGKGVKEGLPAAHVSSTSAQENPVFSPITYHVGIYADTGEYAFPVIEKDVTFASDGNAKNPKAVDAVVEFVALKTQVAITAVSPEGTPLPGASYNIKNPDGSRPIWSGKTGEDGSPTIVTGLKPGKYLLDKGGHPEGYYVSDPMEFTVEETEDVQEIKVTHKPLQLKVFGSLRDENGKPIAGGVLELFNGDTGEVIGQITTINDYQNPYESLVPYGTYDNGTFLGPINYQIRQISSAPGYAVTDRVTGLFYYYDGDMPFVQGDQEALYNKKITLAVDAETQDGQYLAGAKLQLVAEDGTAYADWTSSNTEKVFSGIPAGTYTLKELTAPAGFVKVADRTVKVTATETLQSQRLVHREVMGRVVVKGGEDGFIYEVRNAETKAVVATLTGKDAKSAQIPVAKLSAGSATAISYEYEQVSVPDGYIRDEAVYPFTFTYDGTAAEVEYVINPEAEETQVEVAVKAESGEALKGAEVALIAKAAGTYKGTNYAPGDVVVTLSTASGTASATAIPAGSYILRETKVPEGFLAAADQEITVAAKSDKQTFAMTNAIPQGTLILWEQDKATGKALTGSTFEVSDSKGTVLTTFSSGEDGKAIMADAINPITVPTGHVKDGAFEADVYTVTLVKGSDGYLSEGASKQITFPYGGPDAELVGKEAYFESTSTKVTIGNKDEDGNENIPGATLRLTGAQDVTFEGKTYVAGEVIAEWETGKEPKAFDKLKPGTYTIHEAKAPNGYQASEPVEITVEKADTPQAFAVTEKETSGQVLVYHTDSKTTEPVKGVRYAVREKESGKVVSEFTTEEDGMADSDLMPIGTYGESGFEGPITYELVEMSVPRGYVRNRVPVEFTFTYVDDHTPVVLYQAGSGLSYTRVYVSVYDKTEGNPAAKEDSPAAIIGAKLQIVDGEGTVLDEWESDGNAHVTERLGTGSEYTLRVSEMPAGFKAPEDMTFTVEDTAEIQNISVYAERSEGKIAVLKTGERSVKTEDVETLYGTAHRFVFELSYLAGVEYTVYSDEACTKEVTSFTTAADGRGWSNALPAGTYYIKETYAPAGYTWDSAAYAVEVEEGMNYFVINEEDTKTLVNYVCVANLHIYKKGLVWSVDSTTGKAEKVEVPLSGDIIGIYTAEDIVDYDGKLILEADSLIAVLKTNEEGDAGLFQALLPGSYYYKEIETAPGFVLDTNEHPFTLELQNPDELELIEINREAPALSRVAEGTVKVHLTDKETKAALAGAKFALSVPYGKDIELITDKDGNAEVTGLEMGGFVDGAWREFTFIVKQLSTIAGYTISDKAEEAGLTQEVTGKDANKVSVEVVNAKAIAPAPAPAPAPATPAVVNNTPAAPAAPAASPMVPILGVENNSWMSVMGLLVAAMLLCLAALATKMRKREYR